ncbi:MAG: hypothetical protein ACHP65_06405 [Legionellales bacterium]
MLFDEKELSCLFKNGFWSAEYLVFYNKLEQYGFTNKNIVHLVNAGFASKKLAALQSLLQPIMNDKEQCILEPRTPLTVLIEAGFSSDKLVRVLAHDGGSNNLAALQALLQPMRNSEGQSIVDANQRPLTQLAVLTKAGFLSDKLVGILAHKGGSKNLAALQALLQPMMNNRGQCILDTNHEPLTQLTVLTKAGFSSDKLVGILAHNGGSKNLAALQALLQPMLSSEGQCILDANHEPLTQLTVLIKAGFSSDQLVSVLAHIGGSKNLGALQALLLPINNQGQCILEPRTQLTLLTEAGFSSDKLVSVLAHIGGSKNLEALQALLLPVNNQEQYILDANHEPRSQLTLLIEAGFSSDKLVSVLGHDGGSKNLAALQALLQPMMGDDQCILAANERPRTQLAALSDAGFSGDKLVSILARIGGSKNLEALQALLLPVNSQGRCRTQLTLLTEAGFSSGGIIDILCQAGGAKTMSELLGLLVHKEISALTALDTNTYKAIYGLASAISKSAHIAFISTFLTDPNSYQYIISNPNALINLCKKIKKLSVKQLEALEPQNRENLEAFCQVTNVKRQRTINSEALSEKTSENVAKKGREDLKENTYSPYLVQFGLFQLPSQIDVAGPITLNDFDP